MLKKMVQIAKRQKVIFVGDLSLFLALFLGLSSFIVLAKGPVIAEPPILFSPTVQVATPAAVIQPNSFQASAPDTIYLPLVVRGRTGLWVNPQDRQASLDFYREEYLSSEGVPINWTGNHASCNPGTTSPAFQQAVLRRINYFRAMAGVPAGITFSDDSNRLAQAAALMMSANGALSHSPPTNWKCYTPEGAQGAGSSNLYLGVYSWDAITGYIKDPGDGNYFVGHRRWILHPQTQIMGTGDIPQTGSYWPANALRVFDAHTWDPWPETREEFVAWPPPGFVPYQVVFPRWSFSFANADFSSASVTMTSNGSSLPVNKASPVNGYGVNTLVWIPMSLNNGDDWPFSGTDTAYTVNIHNVLINSQSRDFSYTVIVYDPLP